MSKAKIRRLEVAIEKIFQPSFVSDWLEDLQYQSNPESRELLHTYSWVVEGMKEPLVRIAAELQGANPAGDA